MYCKNFKTVKNEKDDCILYVGFKLKKKNYETEEGDYFCKKHEQIILHCFSSPLTSDTSLR